MDMKSNQLNWRCHLDPSEESRPERTLGRDAPADPWIMRPADWFLRQLGLPWPGAGHPNDADQTRAVEDDRPDEPFVPPAGNPNPNPDSAGGDRPAAAPFRPSEFRPAPGETHSQ